MKPEELLRTVTRSRPFATVDETARTVTVKAARRERETSC
jgi:hypothetical protein